MLHRRRVRSPGRGGHDTLDIGEAGVEDVDGEAGPLSRGPDRRLSHVGLTRGRTTVALAAVHGAGLPVAPDIVGDGPAHGADVPVVARDSVPEVVDRHDDPGLGVVVQIAQLEKVDRLLEVLLLDGDLRRDEGAEHHHDH